VTIPREQWERRYGFILASIGGADFLIGIPSSMSYGVLADIRMRSFGILDAIDHVVSTLMLPAIGIGALCRLVSGKGHRTGRGWFRH